MDAKRILRRLTADAKALDDPQRSMDQKRADVFSDLLLIPYLNSPDTPTAEAAYADAPPKTSRSSVDVQVVVKLETLLGMDSDSALAVGVGQIPADVARELAADGRWRAWVTSTTGSVVATSPRTYHPPESLARLIRAREPYCRMPGCRRPSIGCDLDHTLPWPRGSTIASNMGPICRRHHNLKTHHGWRLRNNLDAVGQANRAMPPVDASNERRPGSRDLSGPQPTSSVSGVSPTRTTIDPARAGRPVSSAASANEPAVIDSWTWTTPTGKPHTVQSSKPLDIDDCPF